MRVPRYWLVSGSAAVPRVAASGVATELSSRMRQRTLSLCVVVGVDERSDRSGGACIANLKRLTMQGVRCNILGLVSDRGVSQMPPQPPRERGERDDLRFPTTSWNGMKIIRPGSAAN